MLMSSKEEIMLMSTQIYSFGCKMIRLNMFSVSEVKVLKN